jgi:hypothetical protein
VLLQCIQDKNQNICIEAAEVLNRIDLEAAAQAGVK